jgi:hypothetical protein
VRASLLAPPRMVARRPAVAPAGSAAPRASARRGRA